MKLENICLDIEKVKSIKNKGDKERVYSFYQDMLVHFQDGRNSIALSLYNSLLRDKYIIDIRDEKIEKVLETDGYQV